MLRNFIAIFVERFVTRADATNFETRTVENSTKMIGTEATLLVDLATDVLNLFEVWLSVGIVMVAVPEDVVGVGSVAAALWVSAYVCVQDFSRF